MMAWTHETERAWRSTFGVVCVDHAGVWPKWGLGDKCLSALLAKSTVLLAACPEQKISVGIAAFNVAVIWSITAVTLFAFRLPNCGSGLMLDVHEADFPHGDAQVRDMRAPDGTGGARRGFISAVGATADTIVSQETRSCCTSRLGSWSSHSANALNSALARGARCVMKSDLLQCALVMTR